MAKGRGNKNPPYRWITQAKWDSLGQTMTIKKALDKWWNSVRIRLPGGGYALIYKCYDGEYELSKLHYMDKPDEEILKLMITLDDDYTEDCDGYPVVYAKFAKGAK